MGLISQYPSRMLVKQQVGVANTLTTCTIAAETGVSHIVSKIHFIFTSGAVGAGTEVKETTLAWTVEGTTYTIQIPASYTRDVLRVVNFENLEIVGDPNTAIVSTLEAGGQAATVGRIEIFYR